MEREGEVVGEDVRRWNVEGGGRSGEESTGSEEGWREEGEGEEDWRERVDCDHKSR